MPIVPLMDSIVTGSANVDCYFDKCMCVWQSLLNGKGTKRDLHLVLGNVTKAKSMALLMRTVVAADVQGQLERFPSSHERHVSSSLHNTMSCLGNMEHMAAARVCISRYMHLGECSPP